MNHPNLSPFAREKTYWLSQLPELEKRLDDPVEVLLTIVEACSERPVLHGGEKKATRWMYEAAEYVAGDRRAWRHQMACRCYSTPRRRTTGRRCF